MRERDRDGEGLRFVLSLRGRLSGLKLDFLLLTATARGEVSQVQLQLLHLLISLLRPQVAPDEGGVPLRAALVGIFRSPLDKSEKVCIACQDL